MKSYSNAIKDEFNRAKFIAVDLVEIYITDSNGDPNYQYLCTGGMDIEWNSNTYSAQGDFIGFSSVSEDFDVKVGKFSIYLSGLNSTMVDSFLDKDVEGKRVVIRKAFLDFDPMTLDVVDTPIVLFDGIIYNISLTESASTATLEVQCATLFADFERTAGRKTNNSSNWLFQGFARDTGFEKSGFVGNTEYKWGRA